ncbi:hypothetical protein C8Q75DRAFT_752664 [Abortiporus biennis]|nr:hypothetical protein C8Q75DRAFT_752664 [Abortiporus biennis]
MLIIWHLDSSISCTALVDEIYRCSFLPTQLYGLYSFDISSHPLLLFLTLSLSPLPIISLSPLHSHRISVTCTGKQTYTFMNTLFVIIFCVVYTIEYLGLFFLELVLLIS